MRATDWLTFDELAALTSSVIEQLYGRTPKVLPLTRNEGTYLDGRTDGRTFFQFPRDGAPAHAALHEIAHWCVTDEAVEHGPRWLDTFTALCQRMNVASDP